MAIEVPIKPIAKQTKRGALEKKQLHKKVGGDRPTQLASKQSDKEQPRPVQWVKSFQT
jgi:hypothetical protein